MTEESQACYTKFQHNAAFARKLEEAFPDDAAWSCVVRFYAAVHLMNAYLIDKKNVRFDAEAAAHDERRKAMAKCPELREAPAKFRELKDLSERVRYDASYDYTAERHWMPKAFLEKTIAIVEPKLPRE